MIIGAILYFQNNKISIKTNSVLDLKQTLVQTFSGDQRKKIKFFNDNSGRD